ncbi:enoyl-[acyl-carrier-protein] reductase FabK, partial [Streptococcus pasteurianus]|nr:enoyl-[acyl-carrier-protein] reductase FabK [Streptococcus pasteurianus]
EATGHPVRVLRNRLTKEYLRVERIEAGKENPDWERLEALGRGALRRAVVEGDTQNSSLMAGQIAGLINKEESCQEIL